MSRAEQWATKFRDLISEAKDSGVFVGSFIDHEGIKIFIEADLQSQEILIPND